MTVEQAAREVRRRADNLRRRVIEAEKKSLRRGVEIGKGLSTGPYSLSQLQKMGHPYARRNVRRRGSSGVSLPAQVINLQSGRFFDSWETEEPEDHGDRIVSAVVNSAPYSGYLVRGTRYMIRRPVDEATMRKLAPEREQRLRQAVQDSMEGK